VAFEGVDGTGTEGVRDDLAFAAVLCAVTHVENAWDTGDESLVVDAVPRSVEG